MKKTIVIVFMFLVLLSNSLYSQKISQYTRTSTLNGSTMPYLPDSALTDISVYNTSGSYSTRAITFAALKGLINYGISPIDTSLIPFLATPNIFSKYNRFEATTQIGSSTDSCYISPIANIGFLFSAFSGNNGAKVYIVKNSIRMQSYYSPTNVSSIDIKNGISLIKNGSGSKINNFNITDDSTYIGGTSSSLIIGGKILPYNTVINGQVYIPLIKTLGGATDSVLTKNHVTNKIELRPQSSGGGHTLFSKAIGGHTTTLTPTTNLIFGSPLISTISGDSTIINTNVVTLASLGLASVAGSNTFTNLLNTFNHRVIFDTIQTKRLGINALGYYHNIAVIGLNSTNSMNLFNFTSGDRDKIRTSASTARDTSTHYCYTDVNGAIIVGTVDRNGRQIEYNDSIGWKHINKTYPWTDAANVTSHTDSSITITTSSATNATIMSAYFKDHIIRWDSTTVKKRGFVKRCTVSTNTVTCIIYGDSLKNAGSETNFQITIHEKIRKINYDVPGLIPLGDTTATGGIISKQISDEGDTLRILAYSAFLETNTSTTALIWSLWKTPYGAGDGSALGTITDITIFPKVRTNFFNNRKGGASTIKRKNVNIRVPSGPSSLTLTTNPSVIIGANTLQLMVNVNTGTAPLDMHVIVYYCDNNIFNF